MQIKVVIHSCLLKESSLLGAQCANQLYLKNQQTNKEGLGVLPGFLVTGGDVLLDPSCDGLF